MATTERTPEQVAEDEARRLHERVGCCPGGGPKSLSGDEDHASIDRAIKAARWAQAEVMLDIYYQHSTVTDNPKIQPTLEAERDRLRREWKEASK